MDKKENALPKENMLDILKVVQALGGGVGIMAILLIDKQVYLYV